MAKRIVPIALIAGCACATPAFAVDVGENTTVGGLVYADLSYISLQNQNKAGEYVDAVPTGTGFDVKRFYLIVDHRFNEIWSANLTTDAQYIAATQTTVPAPTATNPTATASAVTNANSGGVTEVFIKKLYLQGAFDKSFVLRVGSSDTAWVPFIEQLNGYRWIDKVTTDRLGFATSADWGVTATGSFFDNNLLSYQAGVVDGGGYKNPTRTKSPDFDSRIALKPIDWLTLGVGYYEGKLGQVTATNQGYPNNTASRWDAVAAVTTAQLRLGVEYFDAKNFKTVSSEASGAYGTSAIVTSTGKPPVGDEATGVSAWASYSFTEAWNVFARYDSAKLSKDVVPGLKDDYLNAGIDYKPLKPIDVALVYKNEKVSNGSNTVSGADANGNYTIGGANAETSGRFNEYGIYMQWRF